MAVNMTVKVEQEHCSDSSNNNNNTIENNSLNCSVTASSSLDSVVQRLIDKKMGRRKQNCPQRTGATSEDGKTWLCRFYAVLRPKSDKEAANDCEAKIPTWIMTVAYQKSRNFRPKMKIIGRHL